MIQTIIVKKGTKPLRLNVKDKSGQEYVLMQFTTQGFEFYSNSEQPIERILKNRGLVEVKDV